MSDFNIPKWAGAEPETFAQRDAAAGTHATPQVSIVPTLGTPMEQCDICTRVMGYHNTDCPRWIPAPGEEVPATTTVTVPMIADNDFRFQEAAATPPPEDIPTRVPIVPRVGFFEETDFTKPRVLDTFTAEDFDVRNADALGGMIAPPGPPSALSQALSQPQTDDSPPAAPPVDESILAGRPGKVRKYSPPTKGKTRGRR